MIILVLWFNNACALHRGDEKTSSYDFRSHCLRGGLRPHTATVCRSIFIYNIIIIIIIIIVYSLTISYDQFYTKKITHTDFWSVNKKRIDVQRKRGSYE